MATLLLAIAAALAGCAHPSGGQVADNAPTHHPVSLLGATPDSLRTDLGDPILRRIDGSAEVWLYNSRICRLDVIFYPGAAGSPVVSLARPMPRGVSRTSCVASLEQKRAS